jgi:hypothetical protein
LLLRLGLRLALLLLLLRLGLMILLLRLASVVLFIVARRLGIGQGSSGSEERKRQKCGAYNLEVLHG